MISKFCKVWAFRLEFQKFFSITRTIFLQVGQNNFGNKIPFLHGISKLLSAQSIRSEATKCNKIKFLNQVLQLSSFSFHCIIKMPYTVVLDIYFTFFAKGQCYKSIQSIIFVMDAHPNWHLQPKSLYTSHVVSHLHFAPAMQ